MPFCYKKEPHQLKSILVWLFFPHVRGNGLLVINPIARLDGDNHLIGLASDIGGHIPEVDRRRLLGLVGSFASIVALIIPVALGVGIRRLRFSSLGNFLGRDHRLLAEELLPQGLVGPELLRQFLVPHHLHDTGQSLAIAGDEVAGERQLTVAVEVDQFEGQRGAAAGTALQSDSAVCLVVVGDLQTIPPEVLDLVVTSAVFEHF